MRRAHILLVPILLVLALAPADARRKKLDSDTAGAGLKEALSVGTVQAVETLGRIDGFLRNDEVRIEVPEKLESVEKALDFLGQDELVEEFVESMNRAAEAAVPVAKEVFLDAVKEITFEDAIRILKGGDHAATDYLEEKSRDRLYELFHPTVAEKLEAVGATAAFDRLASRAAELPLMDKPLFDLDAYVTDKALDGLFHMVAKEEENIRENVVARTSDLLKEVFGSREARKAGGKKPWWERF
jgi:hypothetical protein